MSNYDDASLIMFPSGYKEDKIYSLKPTDGSGDLTFTRASTATRVNAEGLIEESPVNLAQNSENFSAVWNLYYATITSNSQTAPNGTLTANTLNSTTQEYSGIYQSLGTLPTNVYTYSIYAKAGTNNFFGMLGQGSGSQIAIFNLSTGVVTSTSNLDSASIENVGNDWYRCQIQKTGAGVEMFIFSSNIANSEPTASGTVFIWGAQTNIGSTAKTYFPTTDRLNVPRIDYTGGGCGKLLLEPQRTNLTTYSEDYTNANWVATDASVTTNAIISPDGTQNADKLNTNTTNNYHRIVGNAQATAIAAHTMSIFAKKGEYKYIGIAENNNDVGYGVFDLNTGTVLTSGSGATNVTMQSMGNGWYRCQLTFTAGAYSRFDIYAINDSYTSGNPAAYSFVGSLSNGLYIYGAQLEAGSYVSSYIPTLASSVTRLADTASKTGISSLIGQTSGTVFVDAYIDNIEARANNILFYLLGASQDKYVLITNTGGVRYIDFPNGNITNNGYGLTNGRHKFAIAYANNDFAFYIDGNLIGTDTSGTPSVCSDFGFFYYASGYDFPLKVNESVLFTTRLTNTQLATLTTI